MKRRTVTPSDKQAIEEFRAELRALYDKRRCRVCGKPVTVVIVGQVAVREAGILLQRAQPDRNLCSFHAGLLGSERAA
jgi:hypothetical protein